MGPLAVALFLITIIAAVLGFGVAGTAAVLARMAFFIFVILAVLSFAFRSARRV